MICEKRGNDYNKSICTKGEKMKKYYLSLICVGVILGCIGAAAGVSVMMSNAGSPDINDDGTLIAEQDISGPRVQNNIAPRPEIPEQTSEPPRVKPSTRIVFEAVNQADNKTKVTDEPPPYFLLDSSQDKIREYYPGWDIVEFNEETVKLRRTIPTAPDALYVLGVKDNYVAVYQKANNGSIILKEMTATPIGALSQDEQRKLISGINIQNDNQLAQMLEDYGS